MENLSKTSKSKSITINLKKSFLKETSTFFFYAFFFLTFFFFSISCFQNKKAEKNKFIKVTKKDIIKKFTVSGHIEPNAKTHIVAPYDGYIQNLFVQVGQYVKPGAPLVLVSSTFSETQGLYPLRALQKGTVVKVFARKGQYVTKNNSILRVDDLSNLFVLASVPEMDILKVKKEQTVLIQSIAVSNKRYKGVIKEISLSETVTEKSLRRNRTGSTNYDIKIEITNEDQSLKSGMSVLVDIVTDKRKNALVLPYEFVNKKEEKYFVTLRNGKKRDVQIGLQTELWIEILNLNEGEEVQRIDFYETIKL